MAATVAFGAVPSAIRVTCDVSYRDFRAATVGETEVVFRIWDSVAGGSQLGPDFALPLEDLNLYHIKTLRSGDIRKRRQLRPRPSPGLFV